MHALTALDICVTEAIKIKACGSTLGAVFPSEHFGTEFRVMVELGRFDTKSIKSVPMGTLFQKCSLGNTFYFHAKMDHFLLLFL
jgi:hypothetical protein